MEVLQGGGAVRGVQKNSLWVRVKVNCGHPYRDRNEKIKVNLCHKRHEVMAYSNEQLKNTVLCCIGSQAEPPKSG